MRQQCKIIFKTYISTKIQSLFQLSFFFRGPYDGQIFQPGVNFTNILRASFTHADPKRAKKQLHHQCLFSLLGYALIKTVCKTLVKLTTGRLLFDEPESLLRPQKPRNVSGDLQ